MIGIKTPAELNAMRKSGLIVRDVLNLITEKAREGVTTASLDKIAYDFIRARGAKPSFLNYNGFKGTLCTSIDCEVVHGIPSERVLTEGMLFKVDVGACLAGYHADAARTIKIGKVGELKERLARVTEECFYKGIEILKSGTQLGTLGATIQAHAEGNGFSCVEALVGHGIGRKLHESPSVPNYGTVGKGIKVVRSMTLAVEPMINAGKKDVRTLADKWTVVTQDGEPSAHYENTVIITDNGVEIITL